MKNTKIKWLIVALIVILVLLAVWYFVGNRVNTNNAVPSDQIGLVGQTGNQTDLEEEERRQADAQEDKRVSDIESERAELVAERERIEAQASATTSLETSAVYTQRQQEIDLELLELKNQEEYPPLPDPGI